MFFISDAYAQAASASAAPSSTLQIAYVALIIFAVYFLIFRPQSRRQKALNNLIASLKVNDEVYTAGGLVGKITAMKELTVTLQFADGGTADVLKTSIAGQKEQLEKAVKQPKKKEQKK